MPDRRQYSEDELKEILQRALARQAGGEEGVSHDELVAAAGEVGIQAREVEAAIAELDSDRATTSERELRAIYRGNQRRRLGRHVMSFALVNAFLFAIDVLTGDGWWFFWPLLGWGLALAFHAMPFLLPGLQDPRTFERWKERRARRLHRAQSRRRKELEREARARRRLQTGAQAAEFGRTVEEGVGLLLGALTRRLEQGIERERGAAPDRVRVARPDEEEERVQRDDGDGRGWAKR